MGGNDEARMTNDKKAVRHSFRIRHRCEARRRRSLRRRNRARRAASPYARFWHKVLFDLGHFSKPEPFQRLVNQGIILGEDNRKMSKRWGNVIDPLDVIEDYGADAFRCYEMFMGPLEQMKPWSMRGVEGVARFLARVWRLMMTENQAGEWELSTAVQDVEPTKAQRKIMHATIKKVTEDIETLSFNTAISQMMIFVNAFTTCGRTIPISRDADLPDSPESVRAASHFRVLGTAQAAPGDITAQSWPAYDEQVPGGRRSRDRRPGQRKGARPIMSAARRHRRRSGSGRPGEPENSGTDRGQDDSQGRGCPEKACQHRRRLTRRSRHVERIQRIRGQGKRRRPGRRRDHRRRLWHDRLLDGRRYHDASDRLAHGRARFFEQVRRPARWPKRRAVHDRWPTQQKLAP